MSKHVLAIDIGTQSVRAAVATADGNVGGIAQIPQDAGRPQAGWAEQQPSAWWDMACGAIRQVLSETGVAAGDIAAISCCGQMHGPVGIDESGRITTDWVQLWCDKRCSEQCEAISLEDEERMSATSANPVNPAWTAFKVLWIKEHQRETYNRSRWFLVPKDFINFKLTGVAATDPSEASGTFLWDANSDAYSEDLANELGLDLNLFAPAAASDQVIGALTGEAARRTGLAPGTPVVAGGGDFPVALLGHGIVGKGICSDLTGSSNLISVHSPRPLVHPAVQNLRHVVEGWIPFAVLDCGGMSMKWCKQLIGSARGKEVTYDSLIDMASRVAPGSDGLVFYPYMLGERRRENTSARGGFVGITLNHEAAHFVRAVMEGVAFAMACNIALFEDLGMPVERMHCMGGGIRNRLWNQIKADVLQRPLVLSAEPEAGLRGGALLALSGVGLIDDVREAACRGRAGGTNVGPDPDTAHAYKTALADFQKLYQHLLGYWQNTRIVGEEPAPVTAATGEKK